MTFIYDGAGLLVSTDPVIRHIPVDDIYVAHTHASCVMVSLKQLHSIVKTFHPRCRTLLAVIDLAQTALSTRYGFSADLEFPRLQDVAMRGPMAFHGMKDPARLLFAVGKFIDKRVVQDEFGPLCPFEHGKWFNTHFDEKHLFILTEYLHYWVTENL